MTHSTGQTSDRTAIKAAGLFFVVAGLWLLCFDFGLAALFDDSAERLLWQSAKNALFLTACTLFLFFSFRRKNRDVPFKEGSPPEQGWQEQFEQMATLFDSLNAAIYVADMETHELLYVNRFVKELFGNEWRGKRCYDYLQAGADNVCPFCTNTSLVVDGKPGPPVTWEFRNSLNNRWYQCMDKSIYWTDGRLVRLEIALDITPRKEMEEVKEELLSAVGHEMRTPLTAITGFAELLLEQENLPLQAERYAQTIFREAEKMTDLVNTFLGLRRLKSNQARVDYQEVALYPLIKDAVRNIYERDEHHDIVVRCPADLKVYGNRKELRQVVAQLVSNACRFSPDGGEIILSARQQERDIVLCCQDSGMGIPPEEQERIFDHFHRLDRGSRRRAGGIGLGLSLVKETVALHGGRIWLESSPGHGSRFYVALPACHIQPEAR